MSAFKRKLRDSHVLIAADTHNTYSACLFNHDMTPSETIQQSFIQKLKTICKEKLLLKSDMH